MNIEVVVGDVAKQRLDVIVNAANTSLLGGGGVDGAVHRGAGPALLAACRELPLVAPGARCLPGDARLTPGFALRAAWVAHAVGPVYSTHPAPAVALAAALRTSLGLAVATGASTVAVPALSCGAYHYPVAEATQILVGVARERGWPLDLVRFVALDAATHRAFERALATPAPRVPTEPRAFRRAARADDAAIASIIRTVMPAFGASGEGFAIHDREVDAMSVAYAAPRSAWFVVEAEGTVTGGGGVGPLAGGDPAVCELRKMYFLPSSRGKGLGERLLRQCLAIARGYGYRTCYLETLTGMDAAQRLYERVGFQRLDGPMGQTGHFGCNRFYARDLTDLDPGPPGG